MRLKGDTAKCKHCEKEFIKKKKDAVYCCRKCSMEHYAMTHKKNQQDRAQRDKNRQRENIENRKMGYNTALIVVDYYTRKHMTIEQIAQDTGWTKEQLTRFIKFLVVKGYWNAIKERLTSVSEQQRTSVC